jgi:hypothetical protein
MSQQRAAEHKVDHPQDCAAFITPSDWGRFSGRCVRVRLYGVVSIGAWFPAYFLVPETKGRSLEEIEAHWRAGKHLRALSRQLKANISRISFKNAE